MIDNTWVPLVDYRRNGVPKVTVHGAVAWFKGKKPYHSYGGNVLCYGRSMLKPVQIKVIAKELDPHLSWESKAVSIASHNAEPIHIEAVRDILKPSEYAGYNEVYNAAFKDIRPTRTTVEVGALPTPIAVEFKVIARP